MEVCLATCSIQPSILQHVCFLTFTFKITSCLPKPACSSHFTFSFVKGNHCMHNFHPAQDVFFCFCAGKQDKFHHHILKQHTKDLKIYTAMRLSSVCTCPPRSKAIKLLTKLTHHRTKLPNIVVPMDKRFCKKPNEQLSFSFGF